MKLKLKIVPQKQPSPAPVISIKPTGKISGPMKLTKPAGFDSSTEQVKRRREGHNEAVRKAADSRFVNMDVDLNMMRQIVTSLLNEHGPAAKLRLISSDPNAFVMVVRPDPKD